MEFPTNWRLLKIQSLRLFLLPLPQGNCFQDYPLWKSRDIIWKLSQVEFIWKTDSEYITTSSVADQPSSAHLSMVKYPNSPRTDAVTFTCYLLADGSLAATRSISERLQFGGKSMLYLKILLTVTTTSFCLFERLITKEIFSHIITEILRFQYVKILF